MFKDIPLDKKISLLSFLDKKSEIKSSIETLIKPGFLQKLLGISSLAVDLFAPSYANYAIISNMSNQVDLITISWFENKCKKNKITDYWTCFYYEEKIVGALHKDQWYNQYFKMHDLSHKIIEDYLYKNNNIVHVNCDLLFGEAKNTNKIPDGAIQSVTNIPLGKKILDKQINVLIGPSGSGKTSCALNNCLDNQRVVIAAGSTSLYFIDQLINIFNPDVLILDDIEINLLKSNNKLITVIDRIRLTKVKLFITIMVDEIFERKPGSLYLPGLRPGRVDQIIFFESMSDQDKVKLLKQHKIKFTDISKTKGFTYAYMLELVKTIKEENINFNDAAYRLSLFIPCIEEKVEIKNNVST